MEWRVGVSQPQGQRARNMPVKEKQHTPDFFYLKIAYRPDLEKGGNTIPSPRQSQNFFRIKPGIKRLHPFVNGSDAIYSANTVNWRLLTGVFHSFSGYKRLYPDTNA
jgi:hypothetical protein